MGKRMALNWFYADTRNQQQGPVDAAWLASACRDGKVTAATLVWNETLAGWVPLAQVAAQLGIVVVASAPPPPPPLQAARGRQVPSRPASSSSLWIVVAVVLFALVAFIGILAAIALPAYQDYVSRAKISEAIMQAINLEANVSDFYDTEKRCPRNGEAEIGSAESYSTPIVASIEVGDLEEGGGCGINVTFAKFGAGDAEGKHIVFAMDGDRKWSSSSDMLPKYLPRSMREDASR
jgi:type IV pilus assembly protein PilA